MLVVRMEDQQRQGPFFGSGTSGDASLHNRVAADYREPRGDWPGAMLPQEAYDIRDCRYACQGLREFLTWWPSRAGRLAMAEKGTYPVVYWVPKKNLFHCLHSPQVVYSPRAARLVCRLDPSTLKPLKEEKPWTLSPPSKK